MRRRRLTEQGRRLASERDDLIAQGVDPAELVVPLAPSSSATWPSSAAGYTKAIAAAGAAGLVLLVAVLLHLGALTTATIELAASTIGVILAPRNLHR